MTADGLVICLLGPVRVRTATGAMTALRGHAAHLLAWLALHPGRAFPADDLAGRLWPDGVPPTARTAIQGHVSKLRRILGDDGPVRIETVPGGYVLFVADHGADRGAGDGAGDGAGGEGGPDGGESDDAGTERSPIDVHRFGALCARAAAARAEGDPRAAVGAIDEALALWAGDALAALRAGGSLAAEAAVLDDERHAAEDALADALVAAGDTDRALTLLGRLVNDDPLREHRWALLMVALTRAGRQTDALRAYRRAAAVLVERTGLDPGHELRRLETAILLQDSSLDAARWQPAPGSAPSPLTGVVGRAAERAAVVARLAQARVVTLAGPGGVGKTTLGVDVAAATADNFADGVVVVELGAGGPDDVGPAVAVAVGAPPPDEASSGDDPLARAVDVLARREVLVVLDGCDHVRAEAARAALDLLQAGPRLRILATSQVPLGVAGEAVIPVEPLPVPPPGADSDAVKRSAAAEMLARRLDDMACAVTDDADWEHVATIVRAVDGLPLAIEIAAGSARSEPLAGLAHRLTQDTSSVLDAEPPLGAGRRRLRAALDATVDRLDDDAARLYAQLSLLPGPFDAAMAAAVADVDPEEARALTVQLVASSLVVPDGRDRQRSRLLQPVRAHAATRLGAEEHGAAQERLIRWCVELAAELDRTVHTADQARVIERFMAVLPTFRMVLRHLLDHGDIARAALLFGDLVTSWGNSPASTEAPVWGEELLAQEHHLPPGPRARLEVSVIHCQFAFELIAARLDLAEAALRRAEAAGDAFTTAAAQLQVAIGLGWRGSDPERAGELTDASRAGFLAIGEEHWAAVALEYRGLLALRRLDVSTGIAVLDRAATEHRASGSTGDVAHALMFIGFARRATGDLSGARRAFDEARRVLGPVRVSTWLRATIGAAHAALGLGDREAAAVAFRDAHDRAVEVGDHRIEGSALVGLAAVARDDGDDERGVALLTAAADRALDGGDRTDALTAAGMLAEMLVDAGADEEAAVVLGARDLLDQEIGVRLTFGVTHDPTAVRTTLIEHLGQDRLADLAHDGRVIGLSAAVHRAAERLLEDVTVAARSATGTIVAARRRT